MNIIPKFLRGGNFDSFFTTYAPAQQPLSTRLLTSGSQGSTSSSSSSKKKSSSDDEESTKGKLTERDLFMMIKEIDGLPNEMSALVTNLMDTFRLSSMAGTSATDLATTYLLNLYQLKLAAQNKKLYDEAVKEAKLNGSMAEPAISMDGKLVVQTLNGGIDTVTLQQYLSNKEGYRPLSVSQLANLRAYQPQMVNKNALLDIINNSMGYEAFLALLKQGITSLGSSEYQKNQLHALNGPAYKGLEVLLNLTPEQRAAFMAGTIEESTLSKDLLTLITALTLYLLAVLPDRAKTWAAFKLNTADKNAATLRLILTQLVAGASDTHHIHTDYDGVFSQNNSVLSLQRLAEKLKTEKLKTESDSKEKMTFLTGLQMGYGGRTEYRTLNLGGLANFNASGSAYGAVADLDGKVIMDANLSDVLSKTGIGGITNVNSIWFGNLLVNGSLLNKIAVTNSGAFRVVLPVQRLGNIVKPDWDLINAYSPLVEEVGHELGNNATFELRQALLEKKIASKPELAELLTTTGKLNELKFLPFVIMSAMASDRNFEFRDPETNRYMKLTSELADIDYFKTVTDQKDFDDANMIENVLGWYDKLYKSDVFIPIATLNRLAAIIFSGLKIPDSRAMEIQQESDIYDNNLKVTSSSNLLGI